MGDWNEKSISEKFDQIWYYQLQVSNGQVKKKELFKDYLEKAKKVESELVEIHIFQESEDIDDMSTKEIRYLLIYPIISSFLNLVMLDDGEKDIEKIKNFRKVNLTSIIKYHQIFFELLDDFNLLNSDEIKILEFMKNNGKDEEISRNLKKYFDRAKKVQFFKREQQIDKKLKELNEKLFYEELISPEKFKNKIEDEVRRDFYLECVKKWKNEICQNILNLFEELQILSITNERREEIMRKEREIPVKPMKTLTIKREDEIGKVFGLGYPARPTETVDQFYDGLQGRMATEQNEKNNVEKEKMLRRHRKEMEVYVREPDENEVIEKSELRESDEENDDYDEKGVYMKRNFDEFKDKTKRGEGNRHNRS
ncbi:hypothetical protein SNEBB_001152 [Seison nebaliae]|nr:hypothetical protein SNEBB_001152 [Seison nebaliae]